MRMTNRLAAVALWLLAGLAAPGRAEDTDLFMANPGIGSLRPNVLIILDSTANWSATAQDGRTKYAMEKEALQGVIDQASTANYNIGLMLFTESGGGNPGPDGGYVRSAIREMDDVNRAALVDLIRCLKNVNKENVGLAPCDYTTSDKGNSASFGVAMYEAYLYFKGRTAYAGHNKQKRDEMAFKADADAASTNPVYHSPITDNCAKNQIIFIANGAPDNSENNTAQAKLAALGGVLSTDPIRLNPSGKQATWADEFARFMAKPGNDIDTYTIDVNPLTTGNGPDNTALLQSMANQGKGRYYAVYTGADLQMAIQKALNEILAINSVYASTALPVSVNVRGSFLNEVYMAEFRPDAHARPRWWGNLKLYQLALDPTTDALVLADARVPPEPAQSQITGFISSDVVSFWSTLSNYWAFSPSGTPPSESDSPDGEVVEKGGSAQVERTAWPTRSLYTCTGTGCQGNALLSTMPFATTNNDVTSALLGTADATARAALINWVRGADNVATAERTTGQVRPSLHGDVVHSRPAVVNYNRPSTTSDIVAFFGGDDGILRAVKGGKTASGAGGELWGFVPSEFFPFLKRLRDNSPDINVPAAWPKIGRTTWSWSGQPTYSYSDNTYVDPTTGQTKKWADLNKPYFVDGNVTSYVLDVNGDGHLVALAGDKVYLYVTMRRGGRFLYALDVSVPETPRFLWRRSRGDAGYGELGQTWSEPRLAKIRATSDPVLIMGAGYDPEAEDYDPHSSTPPPAATQGRGVLVINALTGNVIWQVGRNPSGALRNLSMAAMTNSIAAGVTVIEARNYVDGYADRAYAADTEGNVWRVDLSDADTGNWEVHQFASLGRTANPPRKFLYAPDVVYGTDGNGAYDAVLIGSGDREQPFDTSVTNRFYMLKDRNIGLRVADRYAATIVRGDLYDATENLIQVGTATQKAAAAVSLAGAKGWFVTLSEGEKCEGNAITIGGTVFFGTNQWTPEISGSCSGNLGIARIYAMSYKDASATLNFSNSGGLTTQDRMFIVPGGGFLPSPTPALIKSVPVLHVTATNPGTYQTVCFGPTCIAPPRAGSDQIHKLFWYRCIEGEGDRAAGACGN